MSDTTTSSSTPVTDSKKDIHSFYTKANANYFFSSNKDGKACYLNGNETERGIEMEPVCARNAITGKPYLGTNQLIVQSKRKSREFVTEEQIKASGTELKETDKSGKKIKPVVITIPKEQDSNGNWKTDVIFLYSKYDTKNPAAIDLAKLDYERKSNINFYRLKNKNTKDPSIIQSNTIAIAHEYNKMLNYAKVMNRDSSDVLKDITPEEKSALENIQTANREKYKDIPNFEVQCANAYKELKQEKEHQAEVIAKRGGKAIIDARNCHSSQEYLGKYLAATVKEAVFVTDKESINAVQAEITKNLETEFNKSNYKAAFVMGKDASERCKEELSAFRGKSHEQQLGIEQDRNPKEYVQEVEQTVDAISF